MNRADPQLVLSRICANSSTLALQSTVSSLPGSAQNRVLRFSPKVGQIKPSQWANSMYRNHGYPPPPGVRARATRLSFRRHGEIYHFNEGAISEDSALGHRKDVFPAGYFFEGCTPSEPASASPASAQLAGRPLRTTIQFQRTANGVLTSCLTSGGNGKPVPRPEPSLACLGYSCFPRCLTASRASARNRLLSLSVIRWKRFKSAPSLVLRRFGSATSGATGSPLPR